MGPLTRSLMRPAFILLLGMILTPTAHAVDVSHLSAFEHDPCFMALAQRNTEQHVGAPDNALADACDRSNGATEPAWNLVQRLWKPPDISASAPSNRSVSPGWAIFGLVGMLLSYAALGWPLRSLVTLFNTAGADSDRSHGALGAEAALSLVFRLVIATVLALLLGFPFLTALGGLTLLAGLAGLLRSARSAASAPPDDEPASALALILAGALNDAAGTLFGLLALALFAQGNALMLIAGVGLAVLFSLAPVTQSWRRHRRRRLIASGVSGLLAAGVAILAVSDPPVARFITGSVPLLAFLIPTMAALAVAGLVTRTSPRSHQSGVQI